MDTGAVILTGLSVILGGLITWVASKYYYLRSGKELKEEAEKIRLLNKMILESLEQSGLAEIARDKFGNIVGLKRITIHPSPSEQIQTMDEVNVVVLPPNSK